MSRAKSFEIAMPTLSRSFGERLVIVAGAFLSLNHADDPEYDMLVMVD
jgi:hypothetical protein